MQTVRMGVFGDGQKVLFHASRLPSEKGTRSCALQNKAQGCAFSLRHLGAGLSGQTPPPRATRPGFNTNKCYCQNMYRVTRFSFSTA